MAISEYFVSSYSQAWPSVSLQIPLMNSKDEFVSRCRNKHQVQICIPACVISSVFFHDDFSAFGNLRMDIIASKSFTSNSRDFNRSKFHDYLTCEFTAHHACRNAKMNLKSTTNRLTFRIINSVIKSWRYAWSSWTEKHVKKPTFTMSANCDNLQMMVATIIISRRGRRKSRIRKRGEESRDGSPPLEECKKSARAQEWKNKGKTITSNWR